jgi:hypothetical protein
MWTGPVFVSFYDYGISFQSLNIPKNLFCLNLNKQAKAPQEKDTNRDASTGSIGKKSRPHHFHNIVTEIKI